MQGSMDPVTNRRVLIWNAATNALAFVVQLAVAFLLAPLLVRYLGRERYGIWSFVESFLAYFTLFDLGIAATLVRYVPKCRTEKDDGSLTRIVSACLLVFSIAGLLVLVLGAGVFAVVFSVSGRIPAAMLAETQQLTAIALVSLAITLPLSIFPAILDGLGRSSAKSAVRTIFLIIRTAGTLGVLFWRGNLAALALVQAATVLGENMVLFFLVRRWLPQLRPAPWRTDRATLRLIRGYSIDSFLAMLAGRISFKTDAIVIGLFGQFGLIPFFDMPSRLVEYAKNLIRSVTTTLTPAFSALDAQSDQNAIRSLYLNGSRYALYLSLPIYLGFMLFGGEFLQLWLGDESFRTNGQTVLWILGCVLPVAMLQSVAARVLYGTGEIRRFARLMLIEAGCNLGLSLLLMKPLGIVGVALGTAVPNLVMCLVVIVQVCRKLQVTDAAFFRQTLSKPLFAICVLAGAWLGLAQILPPMTRLNYAALVAAGIIVSAILALLLEGRHAVVKYIQSRWKLGSARIAPRR